MFASLILLSRLALSVQSAPTTVQPGRRDISETLYDNLEFFAQYSAAAYCTADEDSAANAAITCTADVCDKVEAAAAYSIAHFDDTGTAQKGIVAIDPTNNLIVVSFQGTHSVLNVIDDLRYDLVSCDFGTGCEVHDGFNSNWLGVKDTVVSTVANATASFSNYSLVPTGHSLGGAVATIAGAYLRDNGYPCDVYTYGSPRVFNPIGAEYVSNQEGGHYRVTHYDDPVPRVPLTSMGFAHTSPEYWLSGGTETTNDYPISSIKVCTGDENTECNDQYSILDLALTVEAHGHYFVDISACS